MKFGALSVCAFLLFGAGQAHAQGSIGNAITDFQEGRHERAVRVFEVLAARGDRMALFFLGRAHYEGKGVTADLRKALDAFSKASDLGDVNAPVWAGQAAESLGDMEASARHHLTAVSRAAHFTSLLALGRMHRRSQIANANQLAAVRYQARAQVIYDALPEPKARQDYLSYFACFDLTQAIFAEERSNPETSASGLEGLLPLFRECSGSGETTQLRARLVKAVLAQLQKSPLSDFDPSASFASFTSAAPDQKRYLLPPPFQGIVAFASDADADQLAPSLSAHRYLNDHLGLPIASSIFPMAPISRPPLGNGKGQDPEHLVGLFSSVDGVDETTHDGLPRYFSLARAWHRGRYDHFHSWYSEGQSLFMRANVAMNSQVKISLAPFNEALRPRMRNVGQVLRLYFSTKPPEDLRIQIAARDGRVVNVNIAHLAEVQRQELDEGENAHVFVLKLPARAPMFALEAGRELSLEEAESLIMAIPSCGSSCTVKLNKLEVGTFDRTVAISQSYLLKFLNLRPYGYTSHGGEGWHVHGDPGMLQAYWETLKAETSTSNVVHQHRTFAMANIPRSRAYIEDVLSDIGVRAVRPERLPGERPPNDAIHDWQAPHKLFQLYRDKMNLATTYFKGFPGQESPLADKQRFLTSELAESERAASAVCTNANCNPAQNGLLALLPSASLRQASRQPGFSHIWYTHFGAPTAAHRPTEEKPFSSAAAAGFERLWSAHYGFDKNGRPTTGPRVLSASTASVMRYRKLTSIIEGGLLPIARQGSEIRVSSTIDPFLGKVFPQAGFGGRDLANLSFEVEDVFSGQVLLDGQSMTVARRPKAGAGRAGVLTIVDDTDTKTIELVGGQPGQKVDRQCWRPKRPTGLFNVSHLLLSQPAVEAIRAGSRLEIRVRPHRQLAFGIGVGTDRIHVLTGAGAQFALSGGRRQNSLVVHRVGISQINGPDWTTAIDLAQPSAYFPGPQRSDADLHMNGTIEDVCVFGPASRTVRLDALRFASPARSDLPAEGQGIVIGGRWAGGRAAIHFHNLESREEAIISGNASHFIGRLDRPGRYAVRVHTPECAASPDLQLLIERDQLDLDISFSPRNCQLQLDAPTP